MSGKARGAWRAAWTGIVLPGAIALAILTPGASLAQQRETALSPDEELETFRLADPRLVVELVAQEPQLDSPVAISWDSDGRLYVAEMIDYPTGPTAGRIRLLEDRDGDGRYEKATVFAAGLKFPNGVLAANGGVFVTAAPDLLFLKDTNGDGQADEQRVVFTGFAEGNQQLRANGLTWGLDNWIHGANGRSDGQLRRPDDPPEKAVSIRARDFRFRPDGSALEATSGQSQFGQAGDDWGNRFLAWNTIPVRHAMFEQGFLDRNPRFAAVGVRDIAEMSDTGRVFPLSPRPQTFNRERTDYYNALCGLTIFRGESLGAEYTGSAFVGESLTNLVHRRLLLPAGPTFVSRRGEHDREFLASADSWFHPVYMTTGPDGALYIVDFYRRWVEHPQFVPEAQRGAVDWQQGTGHGRIWKVSRRDLTWPPRPAPKLSSESTAEVANHLESPNGWQRDTAHRVLIERRDPLAAPYLRAIVQRSKLPQSKLHALAALDGLSALDDSTLSRALDDADGHVLAFAIRLAAPRIAASPSLRSAVLKMADFPNPLVRFQLALSLSAIDGREKLAAMVKLINLEVEEPSISTAVIGSLGSSAGGFLTQLVASDNDWQRKPSAAQMRLLTQVAAIAAAESNGDADGAQLAACLKLVTHAGPRAVGPGDLAIVSGLAQGFAERGQSLRALQGGADKARWASLLPVISAARVMATAENESLEHRLAAVEVLGSIDAGGGSMLLALVDPRHAPTLQSAAAGAVAQADEDTAKALFAAWPMLTTGTRRALVTAALRSTVATTALVAAVEAEHILPRELEPSVRDALLAVRSPGLQSRIKQLFQNDATADRAAVVARYEPALTLAGDRARGAAIFEQQCLTCHSVQGRGQRVGPDLSGVGARPKETLLVDLFDPSRQATPDFVAYTLVTTQGQVFTGLLASETATSVTLRRAEGAQDFVLRTQIEELRGSGKSLMPEGLEQVLNEANVADLIAFLAQPDAGLFSQTK